MTDTDEIVWEYTEGSPYLGWIKDKDARKLVEDLLTETKRLREGIRDICDTGADTANDWLFMAIKRLEELIE